MTGRLADGTSVRVRDDWPESHGPAHVRTPHYLRGRPGLIVRHLGAFLNPDDLAFARPAAMLDLYHVAFTLPALWPDAPAGEVLVELYDSWLQPEGHQP